ncbi:MAG: hypothetical protein FWE37_05235 [Spirochaetaceae bacterium]|nr:hypothetical protein [Spirochaetaceae bacterium]
MKLPLAWQQCFSYTSVTKGLDDNFSSYEVVKYGKVKAIALPLNNKELALVEAAGVSDKSWKKLYVAAPSPLKLGDRVKINDRRYSVIGSKDYAGEGYVIFTLLAV